MSSQIEQRIRLFKIVRDIPFYIAVGEEQDYCCLTKPEILERLLQTVGLKSRHIICEFRWEDLDLPEEILKLGHENSETHEYLEIFAPETKKWVKVDPTWDSRINYPKTPVADWNGLNDTSLAVVPIKTYSPEKSAEFISKDTGEDREKYMERNREFFIKFNKWLESLRKPI